MVILLGMAAHIHGPLSIWGAAQESAKAFRSGWASAGLTYPSSSKQVAAFHRLKDVGGQLRLAGQVGLRQGLLHPLNLHQTQRSLVTCRTHTHTGDSGAGDGALTPKTIGRLSHRRSSAASPAL